MVAEVNLSGGTEKKYDIVSGFLLYPEVLAPLSWQGLGLKEQEALGYII